MRTLALLLLLASVAHSADLTLTWTDNSNNEAGFIVQRAPKPDSGSAPLSTFVEVARVQANVTTYTDSALPPSTAFSYRVAAFNAAGVSAWSNVATATTAALPPPLAPTNLKATPVPIPPQ
jgi:hypothetical protein